MAELKLNSDEIDLEPVEDELITRFTDNEHIPVDHVNFEFEQRSRLKGIYRQYTIFNDTHCYQVIKNKHQRKYKFRIDIAYLDPRPFRSRTLAWKWLIGSLAFVGVNLALVFGNWFDPTSVNWLGLFIANIVISVMCLLAFFYYSRDKVYFRTRHGKIKLVELINKNPDKEKFRSFINKFIMQINKSITAKNFNLNKFLARELQELRRLKNEEIIPVRSYEKAKKAIFKHEAYSSIK